MKDMKKIDYVEQETAATTATNFLDTRNLEKLTLEENTVNNNTTSKHSEKQSSNYNKSYNSANSFHNKRDYSNANQQSTKKYFESTNQPNEQRQSQPLKSFKPKFAKSLSNFVQIENQNTKDSYENLKKKLEACSLDANKNLIEVVQVILNIFNLF